MLKMEFKKAFMNKWFVGTVLFMSLLGIMCAFGSKNSFTEMYSYLLSQLNVSNPDFSTYSLFTYLLFTRSDQPTTEIFYILFPLAAMLPYSWSLGRERKSGYLQNVYTRTNRLRYLLSKGLTTFSVSFTAIAIPLTVNIIVTACMIPAFATDISSVIYTGMDETRLWSSVFYNAPFIYCLLMVLLSSCFAGLWGTVVQFLGAFASNPERMITASFIFLYCLQAFEPMVAGIGSGSTIGYLSHSPLDFLRGVYSGASLTSEASFIPWVISLLVLCIVFALVQKNRDEL